jgi:hypothetical protein
MAVATHILQRPPQFQWDADSYPCKPDNCNPTSVAMVAGFYKDRRIAPSYARKLMQAGSTRCGATNFEEGRNGLIRLGVPAAYGWLTVSALKRKVNAGVPVIISMNYGKLPNIRMYQTDYNFNGWHAVVVVKCVSRKDHNGRIVPGVLVRDPDHASPARPERPQSTFWPDHIWVETYVRGSSGGVACWPKYKKVIPPADPSPYVHTVEVTASTLNIRESATGASADVGNLPKGTRIKTTHIRRNGGVYTLNGVKRTDWLGFSHNGETDWVARGYTKLIS